MKKLFNFLKSSVCKNKLMELILGDCLAEMKNIPNNSIDMIFCDLPYQMTNCTWDIQLNLTLLFTEYYRICKKNGVIALTASQPFTSKLVYENLSNFKTEWIWKKNAGSNFGTVKFQPMKEHESVLIFSNGGGKVTYNPIMQKRAESGLARVRSGVMTYHTKTDVYQESLTKRIKSTRPEERYPSSVQFWDRERGLHPSQKPVKLVEYFIRTYSNENETVLDNCMGSGTTAIACLNSNRRFIGIEKNPKYFETAKHRISKIL